VGSEILLAWNWLAQEAGC